MCSIKKHIASSKVKVYFNSNLMWSVDFRRAVIGIAVEEEDKKHTWMEDAESVRMQFVWNITAFTCLLTRVSVKEIRLFAFGKFLMVRNIYFILFCCYCCFCFAYLLVEQNNCSQIWKKGWMVCLVYILPTCNTIKVKWSCTGNVIVSQMLMCENRNTCESLEMLSY